MMTSLVALTSLFSACKADLEGDYPKTSVELVAGTFTETTLTFTIKANGADDIYYWVVNTATETEENTNLDIAKGTYLDADVKSPFEQEVTVSGLAADAEYHIYAFAKNFVHNSYAQTVTMSTGAAIAVPTVAVTVVEEEVFEDSFMVLVSTTNAKKASWLVVPKYTEGVTAQTVFEQGTALAASKLNKKDVEVVVEGLKYSTEYDFYLAAENQGKQAISDVVFVVTAEPTPIVVEMAFDISPVDGNMNLWDAVGLPGLMIQLMNSQTDDMASIVMYDWATMPDYVGYMTSGMYHLLNGSIDANVVPEATCVLADPAYTNFIDAQGKEYLPVGFDSADAAVDAEGLPYGIEYTTLMPDEDNNLLTINIPAVDETGFPYIIKAEYVGPLGYSVSNTTTTYPFNLKQWGFTKFKATTEGNIVTLVSNSSSGEFKLVLETENGVVDGASFVAGEGGNLTGGYTSFLEGAPEVFEFTQGRIAFEKVDDNGNWMLIVSPRAGDWLMVGPGATYSIEVADYEVTIEGLSTEVAASVDSKRWALPASVSSVLLPDYPGAVCFVDLGATAAGQLLVACDLSSVYGAQAAGFAQALMAAAYTVEATDATSGNIVITVTNMAGQSASAPIPYSELTENSVKLDLTNLFGNMGVGVCECTLFTNEITSMQ